MKIKLDNNILSAFFDIFRYILANANTYITDNSRTEKKVEKLYNYYNQSIPKPLINYILAMANPIHTRLLQIDDGLNEALKKFNNLKQSILFNLIKKSENNIQERSSFYLEISDTDTEAYNAGLNSTWIDILFAAATGKLEECNQPEKKEQHTTEIVSVTAKKIQSNLDTNPKKDEETQPLLKDEKTQIPDLHRAENSSHIQLGASNSIIQNNNDVNKSSCSARALITGTVAFFSVSSLAAINGIGPAATYLDKAKKAYDEEFNAGLLLGCQEGQISARKGEVPSPWRFLVRNGIYNPPGLGYEIGVGSGFGVDIAMIYACAYYGTHLILQPKWNKKLPGFMLYGMAIGFATAGYFGIDAVKNITAGDPNSDARWDGFIPGYAYDRKNISCVESLKLAAQAPDTTDPSDYTLISPSNSTSPYTEIFLAYPTFAEVGAFCGGAIVAAATLRAINECINRRQPYTNSPQP